MRVEDRGTTGLHLLLARGKDRKEEVVECVLRAVIRVNRDGHTVAVGDCAHVLCHRDRAGGAGLDRVAGEVVCATRRDLEDAIRARFGEALQDGVDGLRARHVERGEGVAARLRAGEHLGVLFRGCNRHSASPYG